MRVVEDKEVVRLARERGVAFEVCVTSNHQSGVVSSLEQHPFCPMLEAGLNVTINTDDPSISQIELSDEYRKANQDLGVTLGALRQRAQGINLLGDPHSP